MKKTLYLGFSCLLVSSFIACGSLSTVSTTSQEQADSSTDLNTDFVDLDRKQVSDKKPANRGWAYFTSGATLAGVGVWCLSNIRASKKCLNGFHGAVSKTEKIAENSQEVGNILAKRYQDIQSLMTNVKKEVIGQPSAKAALEAKLKSVVLGLDKGNRGVFFFTGPSSVGKTELAKVYARVANLPFYTEDFSNLKHEMAVTRIIGVEKGYKGMDEISNIMKFLRDAQETGGAVLLDEFPRGNKEVRELFYQVFREGQITGATGHPIKTDKIIWIMTSNKGFEDLGRPVTISIPFGPKGYSTIQYTEFFDGYKQAWRIGGERAAREFETQHQSQLRPILLSQGFDGSLLNRMEMIPFQVLKPHEVIEIVDLSLSSLATRLKGNSGINLTWDKALAKQYTEQIYIGEEQAGASKVIEHLTKLIGEQAEKAFGDTQELDKAKDLALHLSVETIPNLKRSLEIQ